jgi:hypothetical protein
MNASMHDEDFCEVEVVRGRIYGAHSIYLYLAEELCIAQGT